MKKPDLPEISTKSTKEQILAAYHAALDQLSNQAVILPEEQKKIQGTQQILTKVADVSKEGLLSELATLKLKTMQQIDLLSEDLLKEFQQLTALRQAITVEQRHLEDLYQIKDTTHTLAALLKTHHDQTEQLKHDLEEQKSVYDKTVSELKAQWKAQHEQLEKGFSEQKEQLSLQKKREEEEYAYALEVKRRQEADQYEQKKIALEKQLALLKEDLDAREKAIAQQETELTRLKEQVAAFPEMIKKTAEEAESTLTRKLEEEFAHKTQLQEAQQESTLKINAHRIQSLESKIKEQEQLVQLLSKKADVASEQVQSIASKALEASAQRFTSLTMEKGKD